MHNGAVTVCIKCQYSLFLSVSDLPGTHGRTHALPPHRRLPRHEPGSAWHLQDHVSLRYHHLASQS